MRFYESRPSGRLSCFWAVSPPPSLQQTGSLPDLANCMFFMGTRVSAKARRRDTEASGENSIGLVECGDFRWSLKLALSVALHPCASRCRCHRLPTFRTFSNSRHPRQVAHDGHMPERKLDAQWSLSRKADRREGRLRGLRRLLRRVSGRHLLFGAGRSRPTLWA